MNELVEQSMKDVFSVYQARRKLITEQKAEATAAAAVDAGVVAISRAFFTIIRIFQPVDQRARACVRARAISSSTVLTNEYGIKI
jgi:transposase-like protein